MSCLWILRRGVHLERCLDEGVSLLMARVLGHMGVQLAWQTHLEAGGCGRRDFVVEACQILRKRDPKCIQ